MQPVSKQRLSKRFRVNEYVQQQSGCIFCAAVHAEGLCEGQGRSFKSLEFREMSLEAEKLNLVESPEFAVGRIQKWQERKYAVQRRLHSVQQ
jgi:hypothetical protein